MRLRSNGFYGGEMIVVYSMNEHAIHIQSVTAFVRKKPTICAALPQ